jgi:hypothetical protein
MLGTLQILGERNSQLKNENSDGFVLPGAPTKMGRSDCISACGPPGEFLLVVATSSPASIALE